MTIDKDERDSLHLILDALLNARDSLERVDPKSLASGQQFFLGWSKPRKDLVRNGSVFLRRVIGPRLHEEEMKLLFETVLVEDEVGADLAATIANSLRSFLPLFMRKGRYEGDGSNEVIERIIEDLIGLCWGDEPRFFSPWPRRQGLHKRPYRLAKLRLSALNWDKYLSAVEMPAQQRHNIISEAYRTDWEAIRKWTKSIDEQFDLRPYSPENIESTKQEYASDPKAVIASIRRDGDAYWLERNTSQAGKDKQ